MKEIRIIGGGLAGLTLGIGLRQRGVPVTVIEAGHYPRHRVCGEFISGRGQQVLERLALLDKVKNQAVLAFDAAFLMRGQAGPVRRLPQPAICISRFQLDALLADEFAAMGGNLLLNTRASPDRCEEGIVRAAGRRPNPIQDGWAWYGLKIHAKNFPLRADLEMHVFETGYVGASRLPDDEVNICGLFRRHARPNVANSPPPHVGGYKRFAAEILAEAELHQKFTEAALDEASFCSVAGLSLAPQKAAGLAECNVGDAVTMTPPVTGNGMSMAFESAEAAIAPLMAYARGDIEWSQAKSRVAAACDERFASRLRWARWLQVVMFSRALQVSIGSLALRSQLLWTILFRQTR